MWGNLAPSSGFCEHQICTCCTSFCVGKTPTHIKTKKKRIWYIKIKIMFCSNLKWCVIYNECSIDTSTRFLSIVVTKHLKRSNLRAEGFILAQSLGRQSSLWLTRHAASNSTAVGTWESLLISTDYVMDTLGPICEARPLWPALQWPTFSR